MRGIAVSIWSRFLSRLVPSKKGVDCGSSVCSPHSLMILYCVILNVVKEKVNAQLVGTLGIFARPAASTYCISFPIGVSIKIPTASKFFLLQYCFFGASYIIELRYNRQADRSTTTSKHRSIDDLLLVRLS
ncbi:hypothetical protein FRACYDRAFT_268170 [Fragilariopsis cylindrus CCMP1102]|uniref:Uncharacterized protein n=1 Tax=Fragilariopsis cylindrus CCMP1102 TaxID=635003 RepID=A0A1E7FPS1_9STRA|nr:hypothetical protein FRACYDRAFT_268170 [Fragilariopsis cylindrus CCMP1102]|eukprot:OEU20085.1 hypothetical protein FRACYDRAFT_268170 [Fragilariopsis cylindrus CCMP1102]